MNKSEQAALVYARLTAEQARERDRQVQSAVLAARNAQEHRWCERCLAAR